MHGYSISPDQLMEAMDRIGFNVNRDEVRELVASLQGKQRGLDYEEFLAGILRLQIAGACVPDTFLIRLPNREQVTPNQNDNRATSIHRIIVILVNRRSEYEYT